MIRLPPAVLPVIDLRQGQAVHARAGERSTYQPLQSKWIKNAHQPLLLCSSLRHALGCDEFYVADLDALTGTGHHRDLLQQMINHRFRLWLDVGINSGEEIEYWMKAGVHRLIVASESLSSLVVLQEGIAQGHAASLVFSLDLYQGQVRCLKEVFTSSQPMDVVAEVYEKGIRQFMLLDTADVGMSSGCATWPLCMAVRRQFPEAIIVTGGGVRSWAEVTTMQQAGIDRVLVSTLLHQVDPRSSELA